MEYLWVKTCGAVGLRINYFMFYIPSYAWWLVLASGVAGLTACLLLVLSSEKSGRLKTRAGRATFPLLCTASGTGLYFLEHIYRLNLGRPGEIPHPVGLSHLAVELVPLILVLGLAALVVKTWPGWAKLLALSMALDSFVLLFWPGPLVNHLFQLLTVVSVVWGVWGLMIVIKWKSSGLAPAVALLLGGAIGTYCEVGMMFL